MNFVFFNGKVYNTREFRGLARRKIIGSIVDMYDRWPYLNASDLAGLNWETLVDEYRKMEENPNVTEIDKLIALAESENFHNIHGFREIRVQTKRFFGYKSIKVCHQNIPQTISKYNLYNEIVTLYKKEFVNEANQRFFCWSLEP